jgi:hypothetical protein
VKVGLTLLSVKADFPKKKHFYTLSIWKDQDSLKLFLTAEPDATAVTSSKWAREGSAFVEWTSRRRTIDWTEAMKNFESYFYYKKERNRRNNKNRTGPERRKIGP